MHDLVLPYQDWALLALRLMIAAIFGSSGWNHLANPEERSKSIEMSKPFTIFLGAAEFAGALGIAGGVLAGWAALGLILVMLGAIYKKAFVWRTGFWGKGSQGWHYDTVMIVMNFVVLAMGPGKLVLFR
ncbi:MAG TPA: DoxX family protein [Patescibacteria group bacterium]|nr:DoxX family protein [Patescibacteria group bacterium]